MAIPYRTTKFKSANNFGMAILGPTANFNSRQYFWLYGSTVQCTWIGNIPVYHTNLRFHPCYMYNWHIYNDIGKECLKFVSQKAATVTSNVLDY